MLTIKGLIAVLALCISCIGLGYSFGKDMNHKANDRSSHK